VPDHLTVAPLAVSAWLHLQESLFRPVADLARHTPWLHEVLRLYAVYGVVLFALLLLAAWWWARGTRTAGPMAHALWAPLGTLLAVGLNQPLGRAVHEQRPYAVLPHAVVLVSRTTDFSFPSDHAVMAGAVAAGVWFAGTRLCVVAVVLAVLMAFARVYVGAHFPLDVVAGLLVGALVCTLGWLVVRRPLTAIVGAMTRTPLRPLFTARAA
jgi:undecaprenyl-diphosphatase